MGYTCAVRKGQRTGGMNRDENLRHLQKSHVTRNRWARFDDNVRHIVWLALPTVSAIRSYRERLTRGVKKKKKTKKYFRSSPSPGVSAVTPVYAGIRVCRSLGGATGFISARKRTRVWWKIHIRRPWPTNVYACFSVGQGHRRNGIIKKIIKTTNNTDARGKRFSRGRLTWSSSVL